MKLLTILIASILSSIFYRLGGSPAGTLWRDAGCTLIFFITAILLGITHSIVDIAILLASCGLLYASLTTYNKWASKLIGGSGNDVLWPSWFVTGLFYGLSAIPLLWCGIPLWLIIWRSILLGVTTMLWSENTENPWEELGRGALIQLSIVLFM